MLIIGQEYGRLGNRLITFAHFIANAIEYKYQVLDPAFSEYARYFVGTSAHLLSQYPADLQENSALGIFTAVMSRLVHKLIYLPANLIQKGKIPWQHSAFHETITISYPAVYDWKHSRYLDFVHDKYVITPGWVFWDHENVLKHAGRIREYFQLVPYYRTRVDEHINSCREGCDVLIGIHIRQGDYQDWMGGKYYYTVDQYIKLIRRVERLFLNQKVRFMICSDEQLDVPNFADISICKGPGSAIEDMYALAACDYIMGPPSTFSGWASFFGDVPIYFIHDINDNVMLADFRTHEKI